MRIYLGWIVLILSAPVALLGVMMLPNEYEAQGLMIADCDGPFHVAMFAVPGLIGLTGVIALLFGERRKVLAAIAIAVATPLMLGGIWNLSRAYMQTVEYGQECDNR